MELRFTIGITPFAEHEVRGEFIDHLRGSYVAGMYEVEVYRFADNSRVAGLSGADQIGCEFEYRICVELCGQPFFRQFSSITFDAREADFQCITIGTDCFDLNCLAWRLGWRHHGFGVEVERNSKHIRVLDIE